MRENESTTVLLTSNNGFEGQQNPGYLVCAHCGKTHRMELDHVSHECVPPFESRFHVHPPLTVYQFQPLTLLQAREEVRRRVDLGGNDTVTLLMLKELYEQYGAVDTMYILGIIEEHA